MKSDSISSELPGADAVIKWFGYWPDFHDGEILEVHLNRNGLSWLKIYTWNTTNEVDDKGYFEAEKHAIVTFFFEELSDLKFIDFSHQNVIGSIDISRYNEEIRMTLSPCYGLSGYIQGTLSRVEVSPGQITGKNSQEIN